MQTPEVFQNSLHRGSQVIKIPPVTIELPLASTIVSTSINRELAEHYYTVMFGGNNILRSLMVYVSASASHIDLTKRTWGELEVDASGKIADILSPIFPDINSLFLCKNSRQPARIGVVFQKAGKYFLFSFHVYRGAVKSEDLAHELTKSLKVTIL
jgi:hypothetical protein